MGARRECPYRNPFFSAVSSAAIDVPLRWHSSMKARNAGLDAAAFLASGWSGAMAMNSCAEQGVGASRIDFQFGFARRRSFGHQAKADQQAFGTSDPIALHETDFFRPSIQFIERAQQIFGIVGDLEEPLRQLVLLDERAGAPASSVDDLFIGQDGAIDRVPIHFRFLTDDQPGRRGSRGTSSAGACNRPDRRWRARVTNRATGPWI